MSRVTQLGGAEPGLVPFVTVTIPSLAMCHGVGHVPGGGPFPMSRAGLGVPPNPEGTAPPAQ